jgi:prevent-host-death family protein
MRPNGKTISVTDLRDGTREVLENAHFRGQHYVIERAGQPMAVILGIDEYERLVASAGRGDGMPRDGRATSAQDTSLRQNTAP